MPRLRRHMHLTLTALGALAPVLASAQVPVEVPSGQPVELVEVLIDEEAEAMRFRFVAPQIARDPGLVSWEQAAPDMDFLCNEFAQPYLSENQLASDRVVISLSDRNVEFGQADPDATQFFEVYLLENARCIWEEY